MSEGWILLTMIVALVVAVFALRWPVGVALAGASLIGALSVGELSTVRHLVEGTIMYLDPILLVITSLFFMAVFEQSGALASLNLQIVKTFGSRGALLVILLTVFVMFPGMLTGLTAPCVLTTGAMVAPLLIGAGVPRARAGAFIATAAFFGMVAPPVNIAAMLIGGGVDMPYVGFGWPLIIASVPLAVLSSFLLIGRYRTALSGTEVVARMPPSRYEAHGIRLYLPLLVLLLLLFCGRSFPRYVPYVGVPLMFVISGVLGLFSGDRVRVLEVFNWTARQALPILGLLAGIGMFIQILTLTGARGFLVVSALEAPVALRYVAMGTLVPLFGGVSAYGSSSVLGVPLLLTLLKHNAVIVASALSLLASVGDFLPPTKLAVTLAAPVVGEERANRILKHCVFPALMAIVWALGMILLANPLAKMMGLS